MPKKEDAKVGIFEETNKGEKIVAHRGHLMAI
jgi:hypothetical protein